VNSLVGNGCHDDYKVVLVGVAYTEADIREWMEGSVLGSKKSSPS